MEEDGIYACDICGQENVMLGELSLEGVPWAFKICGKDYCVIEAEQRLREALARIKEKASE